MIKNEVWLVTGASGYLASELCKTVRRIQPRVHLIGADVRRPEHRWCDEFLVCSLDRPDNAAVRKVMTTKVDLVIHLAGVAVEGWCFGNPQKTCEFNIRSVYLMLEAIRLGRHPCRFILSTTDKVYGRNATQADPYLEDEELAAKNIYETSKVCADLLTQSYYRSYGVAASIVRFSNIYGTSDANSSRLVPGTMRCLQAGLPPQLRLAANGDEYSRDFIQISDVVEGVIAVARGVAASNRDVVGQAFNISSGKEYRVRDVLEEIIAICKPGARYVEVRGGVAYLEIVNQCASNEKMRRVLGWSPKVSLTEGLRMTWEETLGLRPHLSRSDEQRGPPIAAADGRPALQGSVAINLDDDRRPLRVDLRVEHFLRRVD
jgi:nucleoside-diphosphate-sugar epimerase